LIEESQAYSVKKRANVIRCKSVYNILMTETNNIIGLSEFNLLRKECYFINVGRGMTVNEQELIYALSNSNKILGHLSFTSWNTTVATTSRKTIAKFLIDMLATNYITIHNHPNQDVLVLSSQDKSTVYDLSRVCGFCDIKNADNIDSLDQRVSKLEAYHGQGEETLPDDDNDGVPNEFDQSPNTPEGTMVNFQGIPIPIQDTTINNNTSSSAPGSVLGSVFFDYNRATVNRSDYKRLASVAQYLKMHDGATVKIVGHTDKKGSDEYNEKLSKKRSEKVQSILVDGFGIDSSRLEIVAEGKKTNLSEKYTQCF